MSETCNLDRLFVDLFRRLDSLVTTEAMMLEVEREVAGVVPRFPDPADAADLQMFRHTMLFDLACRGGYPPETVRAHFDAAYRYSKHRLFLEAPLLGQCCNYLQTQERTPEILAWLGEIRARCGRLRGAMLAEAEVVSDVISKADAVLGEPTA